MENVQYVPGVVGNRLLPARVRRMADRSGAKGRIKAPGFFTDAVIRKAYCTAKWNGPAKGMLDPVKEVTAAERECKTVSAPEVMKPMQMTGSGYYSNVEQLKHEEKELREVRKIANGNAGDPATG